MKPGAIIKLPDNRIGTVVYHNLDGYGIVWGEQEVNPDDLPEPEAILRDKYPSANHECVGGKYTLIRDGFFGV